MMLPSNIDRIFHPSLIACMADARAPTPDEIEALAERIRSDMHGARASMGWGELSDNSPERHRALAAARAAFGLHVNPAGMAFVEPR